VRLTLAAVAASLAFASPAAALDLHHVATKQLSPRLQELTFTTQAFDPPTTHVRVLLPDGYATSKRRYPELWLLNGALDDETSWTLKGDAERITAGYPVIVVMPDGGTGGNYTDWDNYGRGGAPMWETFHIGQLLPWIDRHFRTTGSRAGRAIAGLSMGGGGAFSYAARHPDLFTAAAAFSPAVDTNNLEVEALTETAGVQAGHPDQSPFGDRVTNEVVWRGHNPWDLAVNLRGLDLTIRTGNGLPGGPGGDTGDPVEAGVHEEAVAMHQQLLALGIPHVFDDYGAGGHAWYYWQRDLRQLMAPLMKVFAHPPHTPKRVTYKTIDPDYSVFGWHVRIKRPAREFSELVDADRGGFSLIGSGTATVTTMPKLFGARRIVTVHVTSISGQSDMGVRADARGRVTIPLTLGPGNPYQAYSPQAKAAGAFDSLSEPLVGRPDLLVGGEPREYTATVTFAR
jgi:S-formylglutathione hydrolase FrmB